MTCCCRSFGSIELGGRGAVCALPHCEMTKMPTVNKEDALAVIPFIGAPGRSRGVVIGPRFTRDQGN